MNEIDLDVQDMLIAGLTPRRIAQILEIPVDWVLAVEDRLVEAEVNS